MAVVGNIPQRPSFWDFIRGKKTTEQDTAVQNQEIDPDDNTQKGVINSGLGIISLLSLPAITNVFRLAQAKGNVHEEVGQLEKFDPDGDYEHEEYTKPTEIFGYVSKFFELVSSWAFKGKWFLDGDNHDVATNSIGKGYVKKTMHRGTAHALSDLAFKSKYVFSNLFLKTHENAGIFTRLFSAFNKVTSLLGSLIGMPGAVMSSVFAFQGKANLFEAANLLSKVSEPFTAISANVSGLVKSLGALREGAAKGLKFKDALKYKNLNLGHLLQGTLGTAIALPSLPGVIANFVEQFINSKSQLLQSVKKITRFIAETMQRRTRSNVSPDALEAKAERAFNAVTGYVSRQWHSLSSTVANIPILKGMLFKHIMPTDESGKVVVDQKMRNDIEISEDPKNLIGGYLRKAEFGKEIYRFVEPIQSALAFLPEAIVKSQDDYIQDHGTWILRSIDRVIGIVGAIPAAFNYALDIVSSKMPQLIVTYYDHKQRKAIADGNVDYDAMNQIVKLKNNLLYGKLSVIPGSKYLGKTLAQHVVNNSLGRDVFVNPYHREEFLDSLRVSLKADDTSSLKTPALIGYTRNFMKELIDSKYIGKLFKASVDENNLTPRQKGKQRISNFIEKVEHTISAIPILNFAAPILRVIKKPFEVKTKKKKGDLVQGNFGANNNGQAEPTNPLTALAQPQVA